MSITYGKLDLDHDKEKHQDLFREVFGKEMSPELFAWKYQDNPQQVDHTSCMIFVAKDGDRLVGARSFFPGRVFYKDSWYAGAQAGDTMVHPDYRGRGIFTALLNYSIQELGERQLNVLYNFPNQNSLPGNLRQGAKKYADIVSAVKILDPLRAARREKQIHYAVPILPVRAELPAPNGYALTVETSADPQVDQLFFQTFSAADIAVQDRTGRHLNWRFGKYPNPRKAYRFLHLWHEGSLAGYAVLSLSGNGVGEMTDYLVRGHDLRLFNLILKGSAAWFKSHKASHLKTWYTFPQHRLLLLSRGYLPKKSKVAFVTRFLAPVPLEQAPWYISMGDTDTF